MPFRTRHELESGLAPFRRETLPTATISATRTEPDVKGSARLLGIGAAILVAAAVGPVAVGLASALAIYELFYDKEHFGEQP